MNHCGLRICRTCQHYVELSYNHGRCRRHSSTVGRRFSCEHWVLDPSLVLPPNVGDLDLTGVQWGCPFYVDFSVSADASAGTKRQALDRLRKAAEAFYEQSPAWLVVTDLWAPSGRFIMHVTPTGLRPDSCNDTQKDSA